MKTLGKKLVELGFLEYKPGMKVFVRYRGSEYYGIVKKITSEDIDDFGTLKKLEVDVGSHFMYCESTAEDLRPAKLIEKIFESNKFPKTTDSNIKSDRHAYPF